MKRLSFAFRVALLPITFPFTAAAAVDRGFDKIAHNLGSFIERKFDPNYGKENTRFKWGDPTEPLIVYSEEEKSAKMEFMALRAVNRYFFELLNPEKWQPAIELMKLEKWNLAELEEYGISHESLLEYVTQNQERLIAEHPMDFIRNHRKNEAEGPSPSL